MAAITAETTRPPSHGDSKTGNGVEVTEIWFPVLFREVERQRVPLSPRGVLELRMFAESHKELVQMRTSHFTDRFVNLYEAFSNNKWTKMRHYDHFCLSPPDTIIKEHINVTNDSHGCGISYHEVTFPRVEISGFGMEYGTIEVTREQFSSVSSAWQIKVDCGRFRDGDYHTTVMISGDITSLPQLHKLLEQHVMTKPVRPMIFEFLFRYYHDLYVKFEENRVIPQMQFTQCVLPEQFKTMEASPKFQDCLHRIRGVAHLPPIEFSEMDIRGMCSCPSDDDEDDQDDENE